MFCDIIKQIKKTPSLQKGYTERQDKPIFSCVVPAQKAHLIPIRSKEPISSGGFTTMKIPLIEVAIRRTPQGVYDLLEAFNLKIVNSHEYPFFDLAIG